MSKQKSEATQEQRRISHMVPVGEYWCPRGFRRWEVCATVSGSAQALCQHLGPHRTEQHCALMRGVSGNLPHTHSKPEKPSFLAQQCSRGQPSMQQHMTINTIYTYTEKPTTFFFFFPSQNHSWSWKRFFCFVQWADQSKGQAALWPPWSL